MNDVTNRPIGETETLLSEFHDEFKATIEEIASVFYQRSESYDNGTYPLDHFPFGEVSFLQLLWMKLLRIYSLTNSGTSKDMVPILKDSITDLVVYATIFLIWVKRTFK